MNLLNCNYVSVIVKSKVVVFFQKQVIFNKYLSKDHYKDKK